MPYSPDKRVTVIPGQNAKARKPWLAVRKGYRQDKTASSPSPATASGNLY
jgi:hypothetical protein